MLVDYTNMFGVGFRKKEHIKLVTSNREGSISELNNSVGRQDINGNFRLCWGKQENVFF